jgi:drug/metabolite transporter (DMT)-like permease
VTRFTGPQDGHGIIRECLDLAEEVMSDLTLLKLAALMFAVLWTGWMLWSSESLETANIVMLAICGALAGYFWYRAMRYFLIDRLSRQPRGRA